MHYTDLNLKELDVFGEWKNPQALPEVMRELRIMQLEGVGVEASVGFIRANRPNRNEGICAARRAQLFWGEPLSKAHLLNALFRRGLRTITELEVDPHNGLGIPNGKVYAYLKNAKREFRARPRKRVVVRTLDGEVCQARVIEEDLQDHSRALLKVDRVFIPVWGRWSVSDWCYKLLEPLALAGYTNIGVAGRVMVLPKHLVSRVAARSCGYHCSGDIPLALLGAFVPKT